MEEDKIETIKEEATPTVEEEVPTIEEETPATQSEEETVA